MSARSSRNMLTFHKSVDRDKTMGRDEFLLKKFSN